MKNSPLAIVMGRGDLPALLVDFCKRKKRPYILFPIISQAEEDFVSRHPHVWIQPGYIQKNLELFRQHNIKEIVFVGHVHRSSFLSFKFDFKAIKWLFYIGWKACGDDGLLSGIVGLLETEGFKVTGVHHLIQEILMPKGHLGKRKPSQEDKRNILIGFSAAKELGRQDIGQGVVVEAGKVLATEDSRGTDALLARAAPLISKKGQALLVKVSKPAQEKKVDLPTIGPKTIENLIKYGYKGVALEAGLGLILHQEKVISLANQKGIFVYGVTGKKN